MSRHCEHCGTGRQCYSTTTTVHSVECPYCLAAEVEALREKVKQHEVVFKVQAEALKSTREQVQRVREKPYLNARPHGQPEPWREGYNQALREVLRALDGDNDA